MSRRICPAGVLQNSQTNLQRKVDFCQRRDEALSVSQDATSKRSAQPWPATDSAAYRALPMPFEANQGQTDKQVKFLARGKDYAVFLTAQEAVILLTRATPIESAGNNSAKRSFGRLTSHGSMSGGTPSETVALRMKLSGSNTAPIIEGVEALPGRSHYFLDAQQSDGTQLVPQFARVRYRGVYPGIDLVFYGKNGELEYDFIVAPGTDPSVIRMVFAGASALRLNAAGDVVFANVGGGLFLKRPCVYQDRGIYKEEIEARYVVEGKKVRFRIGKYEPTLPLVIDPILTYASYLGGNESDYGTAVAVDRGGIIYLTGQTHSRNFPVANAIQGNCTLGALGSCFDAFVTKIDVRKSAILYSTYLGGPGNDRGADIAVDDAGNAFVVGIVDSNTAFVAKLDPEGRRVYFTTFGGYPTTTGRAIAVDESGNAYITGDTLSNSFPTVNALQPRPGGVSCSAIGGGSFPMDAFVAKLGPTGVIVYATYLGGDGNDWGLDIATDRHGNVYVTGETSSANFPVNSSLQAAIRGGDPKNLGVCNGDDAFLAKLNPSGSGLVYATYLGGSRYDSAESIAVDRQGSVYLAGKTRSSDFPTQGAFQRVHGGGEFDGFVAKVEGDGTRLAYASFLGGSASDYVQALALEGDIAHVTGWTMSSDFPVVDPFQASRGGDVDAFVSRLAPHGSALLMSSYIGGSAEDFGEAITIDRLGTAYVTGTSRSANFPKQNAIQPGIGGVLDAFLLEIAPQPRQEKAALYYPRLVN